VKLCTNALEDGRRVRGYMHPETDSFVQIDI